MQVDDIKCIHAHVADTLLRGPECNAIGALALDLLERKGVDPRGCSGRRKIREGLLRVVYFIWGLALAVGPYILSS